jgi:uncharacterized membrane protein YgcG
MKIRFLFVQAVVICMVLLTACGGNSDLATQTTNQPVQDTGSATGAEQPNSENFFLEISNIRGEVEVRANSSENYVPAEVGQKLYQGAQLRTGADGIVALYRDSLTLVVVDNNSEAEIKTLAGTAEAPVTILMVTTGAVAVEHHAEELPAGAVLKVETPEGNGSQILGSTVRVQYNPETKVMTATCLTGTCEFVRGDQKLTLEQGQAVDVTGLQPPPGAPEEMTVDQANQFLAMGGQLCGCQITIGEIRDGGLSETSPAPESMSGEGNSGGEATEAPTGGDSGSATEAPADNNSGGGDDSGGGGDDSGGGDGG